MDISKNNPYIFVSIKYLLFEKGMINDGGSERIYFTKNLKKLYFYYRLLTESSSYPSEIDFDFVL